jgi:hypothetical protein
MAVTIASFTFDYSRAGSTGYLRFYADSEFFDPDGVFHPAQAAGGRDYLKEVAFTVASNVATVPSFTLPATWDEAAGARSSVTVYVLDSNRQKVGILVSDFRIPSLPAITSWGALLTHNTDVATIRDTDTYTKQQTDYQIAQAEFHSQPATTTTLGGVRTSVAPVDAAIPIARVTNDPLVIDAKEYASLSAAIDAIGVTDTTLNISTALTVTADKTVPSNVTLRFVGAGRISVNAGMTLTFAAGSHVIGEPRKLFAGSGTVAISSNHHKFEINPVWFADGSGTLADPWTGWSAKTPWASHNSYRFTPGFYSYSLSPAFARPGIRLYGRGAYLLYTGSGAIMDFLASSHSPGTWTYGVYAEGFMLDGVNASHGLYLANTQVSIFRDFVVRNMPGIGLYSISSHANVVENFTAWEPVGTSLYGSMVPTPTVVPTTGMLFDDGGSIGTNNAYTIINPLLSYINGKGIDIQSLISSKIIGGAVERCDQEGIVIGPGNDSLTNSITVTGTEVEFNNGVGSDIYINAKSVTIENLLGFNAVISVDAGAVNTKIEGGMYETINILSGAVGTSLDNLIYDYSGSGDISDAGTRTSFGQHVIHRSTGKPYPHTSRNITPAFTIAGATVEPTTYARGAYTIATGFALSADALSGVSKWKLIFRGVFYDAVNGAAAVQNAPYLELTSEQPTLNLGGGVTLTFGYVGGKVQATVAGTATIGFAGTIDLIPNSYGAAGSDSIDVKGNIRTEVGFFELGEMTAPSAPAANRARLYVEDNGAGKSRLVVRFPSGAAQVIATEP